MDTPASYRAPVAASASFFKSTSIASDIEAIPLPREVAPGFSDPFHRSFSETIAEKLNGTPETAPSARSLDRRSSEPNGSSSRAAKTAESETRSAVEKPTTSRSTEPSKPSTGSTPAHRVAGVGAAEHSSSETTTDSAAAGDSSGKAASSTTSDSPSENSADPQDGPDSATTTPSDLLLYLSGLQLAPPPTLVAAPLTTNSGSDTSDPLAVGAVVSGPSTPVSIDGASKADVQVESGSTASAGQPAPSSATNALGASVKGAEGQVLHSTGLELPMSGFETPSEATSAQSGAPASSETALDKTQGLESQSKAGAVPNGVSGSIAAQIYAQAANGAPAEATVTQQAASMAASETGEVGAGGINPAGTSTADKGRVMKTEPTSSASSQAPLSATSSSEGSGNVSIDSQAVVTKNFQPGRKDGSDERKQTPTVAEVMAGDASRSAHGNRVEQPDIVESVTTTDLGAVESLRQQILTRAVEFRDQNPSSMTVVLRPDSRTELSVQMRSGSEGKIEVQVKVERGDASVYHGAWDSLQQSLAQRGVTLSGLQIATPPSLHARNAVQEARGEGLSGLSGAGALEARMTAAAAGTAFSFQQDQRDSQSQSRPSPQDESRPRFTNDSGSGQGDPRQAADQQRDGSSSRPSVATSPFRRAADGAASSTGTAGTNNPPSSAASAGQAAAPFESWA